LAGFAIGRWPARASQTVEMTEVRVLVAEDHDVVRQGIRLVLETEPDIRVVAEARDAPNAVAGTIRAQPDVVLMDVRLANGSGIEATREIHSRAPNSSVLMLTSYADDEAVFASIMAGAAGYMLKTATPMELIHAVRRVAHGESLLAPSVTQRVLTRVRQSPLLAKDEKLASLTAREDQVLTLLATGKTNAQIARDIHISEKTVKNHVSTILGKLEVARRTEAAAYFAQHRNPFG
jgi:two-component system, NarL family, response regulator DevR